MTGAGAALRSGGNALLGRAHAFAISRERAHRSSSSYSCTAKPPPAENNVSFVLRKLMRKKTSDENDDKPKTELLKIRQNSTQDQTKLYLRSTQVYSTNKLARERCRCRQVAPPASRHVVTREQAAKGFIKDQNL